MKNIIFLTMVWFLVGCGKPGSDKSEESSLGFVLPSGEHVEQAPVFKYEHSFLAMGFKGKRPKLSDEKYSSFSVKRNPEFKNLNFSVFEKGTREVSIHGLIVELGNNSKVYDLIRKATDVRSLKIYAHTLVIKDEIHVAQADVEIHAVKVLFKEAGKINTTPISKTELPKTFKNGEDGLAAGSVTILAKEVKSETGMPVIVAIGGDGQSAGPGMHGARGKDAKVVKAPNYTFLKYYKCTYRNHEVGETCRKKKVSGWRSGNGADAKAGGVPGHGGPGGSVWLSKEIADTVKVDNRGGGHGRPDIERKGGRPGNPATTCNHIYNKKKRCVTARRGKDISPRIQPGAGGKIGRKITSSKRPKLDKALFHYTAFVKDLYMQGHFNEAHAELHYIANLSGEFSSDSALLRVVRSQIGEMLGKLELRLDFYGNPRTWVPKLGFVTASKAFVEEGDRNLKLFFLSKTLKSKHENLENKYEGVKELQNELLARIDENRKGITTSVLNSNDLQHSVNELNVAKEEFELELRLIEKKIEQMAKNNLKVPLLKKALKTLALAAKVVPVGQPSFGAVGVGLDVLEKAIYSEYSLDDFLKEAPEVSEQFDGFDWKGATLKLQEKLDDLNPREFSKLESNKERLEYIKDLGEFAAPIVEAIGKQRSAWKEHEVSKSSLNKEIERIKAHHKEFQQVVGKLNVLLTQKEGFLNQVRVFQSSILERLQQIDSDFLAVSHSYEELASSALVLGDNFKTSLLEIHRNALRRFNYYSYVLSKAYGYQYGSPFQGSLSLDGFYNKCELLFAKNIESSEKLERMKELFEREVADLAELIVLNSSARDELATTVELSPEQVRALNKGRSIYLDFTDLEFFGKNKENIRLNAVKMEEGSSLENFNGGEVYFEHVGEGIVYKDGKFFFFTQDTSDIGKWINHVVGGEIYHSESSDESGDEVRSMLGMSDGHPVFSKPTGRTFVKVSTSDDIQIKNARIRVEYSFEHAN